MIKRLLIVLDDCGPGDALVVDFCIDAILRAHPDAAADLLVSEQAAPVFARDVRFRRIFVSGLYEQRARSRSLLVMRKAREASRLAWRLGRRYDLSVTFYWGTTLLNLLARLATRGRSLGYANSWPGLLDCDLGRYMPDGGVLPQAARVLATMGLEAEPAVPPARKDDGDDRHASALLEPHGLGAGRPMAVLHVGSDWACQQWLPERWAEAADRLALEMGMDIVFTGVRAEAEQIDAIRRRMRAHSVSLAGMTSVAQLAGVLRSAALCICVDSLAFELAQAAGVACVVLAGQSRTEAIRVGPVAPIVVNRSTLELRAAILACKLSFSKASFGGCLHYGCPMAGLRDIELADVMVAVSRAVSKSSAPMTGGGVRV